MPSVKHFIELLEAASRRDNSALLKVGKEITEEERRKKHFKAARQIEEAIKVVLSTQDYELHIMQGIIDDARKNHY